jgi:hypothetical protein
VVNLEDLTFELNNLIGLNQILEVVGLAKLLSLQWLPTKKRKQRKEMVHYFSSHVATSYHHLIVLKQKVVDKEIVYKIRELKSKEKNEKRSWRVQGAFTQVQEVIQRRIEKEYRVKFNDTWSIVSVRAIGERFHNNFRVRFWGPSYKVHRV